MEGNCFHLAKHFKGVNEVLVRSVYILHLYQFTYNTMYHMQLSTPHSLNPMNANSFVCAADDTDGNILRSHDSIHVTDLKMNRLQPFRQSRS